MAYLRAPIDTDVASLIDAALDRIRQQIDGWEPREGHLEVVVIEELARIAHETAVVASTVPDAIFSAYGRRLHDIVQQEGAPATVAVEVVVLDTAGYNVPAGTQVAWEVTGDERVFFTTNSTLTIPAGSTSGVVTATAEDAGTVGNGLGPGPAVLVDQLAFVDQVAFDTESSGGIDPETDVAYRDRLADELQLQSPAPILPGDFAVLARRTTGVHRALALDLYDADTDTDDVPRTLTLVPVGADGLPSSTSAVDALIADMEARREVNFVVRTDVPTYTPVDVDFAIVPDGTVTDDEALDRAVAAVSLWLDPANWGGGDQSPPRWELKTAVRYLELAGVIAAVDGVGFISSLTIDGGEVDVTLPGRAPLPAPQDTPESGDPWTSSSTVTGTVA